MSEYSKLNMAAPGPHGPAIVSAEAAAPEPWLGRYPKFTRMYLEGLASRLHARCWPNRQPVTKLEMAGPVERISYAQALKLNYQPVELGQSLGPDWATNWFRLTITTPAAWTDRKLVLHWDSKSEALLWMDGRSMQGLNPGRERATLRSAAVAGETFTVYIEQACNGMFGIDRIAESGSAIGRSLRSPYWLARCEISDFDPQAWSVYHDFEVLRQLEADRVPPQTSRAFANGQDTVIRPALDPTWAGYVLYELNRAAADLELTDRAAWERGAARMAKVLAAHNGSIAHELSAIGHAHIDTAWLWPLAETTRKCQRTFSSAVTYMAEYPNYRFACSQAYQYDLMERVNPDLFARIKQRVETGQWVPVGGTWIEPDCNLPAGESLCRQFLYGQRYFASRFGQRCQEFWNPDVFGYNAQLPQIMRHAGIARFLTQKLSWNAFTVPMHHTFRWRGLDGSEVLTHFPPADSYNGTAAITELRYHGANYKDADRSREGMYLFGHGDGGGGPTPEMLEVLERVGDLQGLPRCTQRSSNEFFARLEADAQSLAVVEGELYFELHRGTFTTQALIKRLHRRAEALLHDAEFLAARRMALQGAAAPQAELAELWKLLLLNEFHDILPGSSIELTNADAQAQLGEVCQRAQALCAQLTGDQPVRPLNTIAAPRAEVATGPAGELCWVEAPAYGVGAIGAAADKVAVSKTQDQVTLSNQHLRAVLARDGRLLSLKLCDAAGEREALAQPANQLVLFCDKPARWDAWDVDPNALEYGRALPPAESWRIEQLSPLRATVTFSYRFGKSSLTQVVTLDAGAAALRFDCQVDWHEQQQWLKVLFPVQVHATSATYETAFGAVQRPTTRNNEGELAKYEVPGHRWADMSEPGFGVALLSDSKYGYSAWGRTLGLSLLRGPLSPDPQADQGEHEFAYALLPHRGDWRQAQVVSAARRFQHPLRWVGQHAPAGSLAAVDQANLVLDTIKPAEAGDGVVLRLYETHGQRGSATLRTSIPVTAACLSNTMEDDGQTLTLHDGALTLSYRPFELITVKLRLS